MLDLFISRKACNTFILYNENKDAVLVDPGFNEGNRLIEHIERSESISSPSLSHIVIMTTSLL